MMILIIDTNILIAELLRQRGRELLRNQQLGGIRGDRINLLSSICTIKEISFKPKR